jgi:hypothetical protein
MMQIADYIFYRLYVTYDKAGKEPAYFTGNIFFAILIVYVSLPTALLGMYFFKNEREIAFVVTFAIVSILDNIIISRRYSKKKIKELLVKYRYHKCNKWLKSWIIFVVFFIVFVGGVPIGFYIGGYLISGVRAIAEML